jgi:general secretion pathway protein H
VLPAGWSLIELIIVLAIIAAVSSLALPGLRESLPSLRLSAQARSIAVMLREAERQAVESGNETVVRINLADRSLTRDTGEAITLDPQFAIEVTAAKVPAIAADIAQIRFFPDGTSTGADLRLSYRQRHVDVVVDWMFGRAALKDD